MQTTVNESSPRQKQLRIGQRTLTVTESSDITTKHPTGKVSGLRLFAFLRYVFEQNELNENERLTDAEIASLVRAEFGDYPDVMNSLNSGRNRVAIWRSNYNTGRMGGKPVYVSLRYNSQGQAIDSYTGEPLSPQKCKERAEHYGIDDPRYAKAR
jgi:hypothetical protein